jgi:hypothetical protein
VDITLANAQIEEHDNGLSVIEKLAYMPLLFPGVSMCLKCSQRSQENFKHTDVEKRQWTGRSIVASWQYDLTNLF